MTRQANVWTNSKRLVKVLLRGCHVAQLYSRIGRTGVMYRVWRRCSGAKWKFLWIRPIIRRAVLKITSIWMIQESLAEIRIPKNVMSLTLLIAWLFRWSWSSRYGLCLVEMTMAMVFLALACKKFEVNQSQIFLMSSWKASKSCLLLIGLYRVVLSAYKTTYYQGRKEYDKGCWWS